MSDMCLQCKYTHLIIKEIFVESGRNYERPVSVWIAVINCIPTVIFKSFAHIILEPVRDLCSCTLLVDAEHYRVLYQAFDNHFYA